MDWLPSGLEASAKALLAGFVAAWIFHGLTAHPKASPFERGVQALIFTAIVRVFLIMIRAAILWIGSGVAIGTWTDNVEFVWSMALAGVIGFLFAWAANRDWPHTWLRGDEEPYEEASTEPAKGFRGWLLNQKVALKQFCKKLKVTKKTAYPSEWFQLFNEDRRQYW